MKTEGAVIRRLDSVDAGRKPSRDLSEVSFWLIEVLMLPAFEGAANLRWRARECRAGSGCMVVEDCLNQRSRAAVILGAKLPATDNRAVGVAHQLIDQDPIWTQSRTR